MMRGDKCALLLLSFVLTFTIVFPFLTKNNGVGHSIGIQELNNALARLLSFLDEQHRVINVDCIFCLRVVEGQLDTIQMNYEEGKLPHVHNTVIHSLNKLQQQTALINSKALLYTLGRDPAYTKSFLRVIDTPFQTELRSRRIQPGFVPKQGGESDDFKEEDSDECMSNLLGSEIIEPCTVSNECWQFVTMIDSSGYLTTHQALFLLIAEKTGCIHRLEEKAVQRGLTSIDKLYERICTSIYHEAKRFADSDVFPDDEKDLFMEQIALCAQAGFSEFLNLDWLQLVLSWQSESGCYQNDGESADDDEKNENEKMANKIFGADKGPSNLNELNDIAQQFDNGDIRRGVKPADITAKFTSRKLLREKVLPNTGGCLSHMTGIAAACLVMFFHHFLAADHYTDQLLYGNVGDIGVDLEGRVVHLNANRPDRNRPLATEMEANDIEKSGAIGETLPLQSVIVVVFAIFLVLCCLRSLRRVHLKNWLKRRF